MRTIAKTLSLTTAIVASLTTMACGDDSSPPPVVVAPSPSPPAPTPTPSPSPSPSPSPGSVNVTACVNQTVVPGRTVANLVIPDVVSVNLTQPSGFPNGRRLQDPVIDVTLAVILLDLTRHSPGTLASVPVNPPANEVPFLTVFPFVAPPNGTPPIVVATDLNFNFRTDARTAYTRVDRMGMPAVATALITGNPRKDAYNDANPSDDAAGTFVPDIVSSLTSLHSALRDDLLALGLTPCSTVS